MPLGTSPAPESSRSEIEQQLQEAVETARAELSRATDRGERARAAERLRAAVKEFTDFTLRSGR